MINFEGFKKEVVDRIKEFLPEEYQDAEITIEEVRKANDQVYSGLMIKKLGQRICPTIYLEGFYEYIERGESFESVLKEIASIRVDNDMPDEKATFDPESIYEFNNVKDLLAARLLNTEANAEYLANKPHKEMGDLSIVYAINVGRIGNGEGCIIVTDEILKIWDISVDELHKVAVENISQGYEMESMARMIANITGMYSETEILEMEASTPMWVLTNQNRNYGAAVILSEEVRKAVTEKLGDEFIIIPSSVHELILIKMDEMPEEDLTSLIQDVNMTQVAPNERLSDHPYICRDGVILAA